MQEKKPAGDRLGHDRGALVSGIRWMTTHSLVFDIAAMLASHVWTVLNMDVRQLARRD